MFAVARSAFCFYKCTELYKVGFTENYIENKIYIMSAACGNTFRDACNLWCGRPCMKVDVRVDVWVDVWVWVACSCDRSNRRQMAFMYCSHSFPTHKNSRFCAWIVPGALFPSRDYEWLPGSKYTRTYYLLASALCVSYRDFFLCVLHCGVSWRSSVCDTTCFLYVWIKGRRLSLVCATFVVLRLNVPAVLQGLMMGLFEHTFTNSL